MRAVALQRNTTAERMVECLVFCIQEIPLDPHLKVLKPIGDQLTVSAALRLAFVQEELIVMSKGEPRLSAKAQEELSELLLRLLLSFLLDSGAPRTTEELRAFLCSWLVPMIEAHFEEMNGS